MHRSGTSATIGTIQRHGFELGPASETNRFNRRGNRELRALGRLHDEILERSGGSWWKPPTQVSPDQDDRRKRDDLLASIPGDRVAVKDPRILLVVDWWRELDPLWIGVIRNPVAVRASLERRVRKQGRALLEGAEWESLWCHYNRILLSELERRPFPVVNFDRPDELDAQVWAALARLGLEAAATGTFFDAGLVTQDPGADWRDQALLSESVDLWDRLAKLALA
jgi:hypothetical protein